MRGWGLLRVNERVLKMINGDRGFTLIETILSLSILVLLLGLVLSSLRLGQRSWERGEAAVVEAASKRFLVKRFSEDIASMYLYAERRDGKSEFVFNAGAEEFGFVTANRAGTVGMMWGGLKHVSYFADEEEFFTAKERTLPLVSEDSSSGERLTDLAPHVEKVKFEYLGSGGWESTWDIKKEARLPGAVRAEFLFSGDKRPLVVTAPVGVTNTLGFKSGKTLAFLAGGPGVLVRPGALN